MTKMFVSLFLCIFLAIYCLYMEEYNIKSYLLKKNLEITLQTILNINYYKKYIFIQYSHNSSNFILIIRRNALNIY